MPVFEILSADIQRVASKAPAQYKPHVQDTETRLTILFNQLNEDTVRPETVAGLTDIAKALQGRQYEQAQGLFTELMKATANEGSAYMVSSSPWDLNSMAPLTDSATIGRYKAIDCNEQSDAVMKR